MELMVVNPIGDISELEVPKTTLPFFQSDKKVFLSRATTFPSHSLT
jgi:hypothetical protein